MQSLQVVWPQQSIATMTHTTSVHHDCADYRNCLGFAVVNIPKNWKRIGLYILFGYMFIIAVIEAPGAWRQFNEMRKEGQAQNTQPLENEHEKFIEAFNTCENDELSIASRDACNSDIHYDQKHTWSTFYESNGYGGKMLNALTLRSSNKISVDDKMWNARFTLRCHAGSPTIYWTFSEKVNHPEMYVGLFIDGDLNNTPKLLKRPDEYSFGFEDNIKSTKFITSLLFKSDLKLRFFPVRPNSEIEELDQYWFHFNIEGLNTYMDKFRETCGW